MTDVLENYKKFNAFSEIYEVVRTTVVVMDDNIYRIEVHKDYSNSEISYKTSCWVQEHITAQPTYPETGGG